MTTNPFAGMTMEEKVNLGRRRILSCLAHLENVHCGGHVGLQDLQKLYLRVFERDLNKEEYRCLFGLRHVKPIFHKYMANDIELSTDMDKTGSLYMHLKRPLKEAIGEECPEELLKCAAVTEGKVVNEQEQQIPNGIAKSAAIKPTKPAYRMLESSDEEEGGEKVAFAGKKPTEKVAVVNGGGGIKQANEKIETKMQQQAKAQENLEEENEAKNGENDVELDGEVGEKEGWHFLGTNGDPDGQKEEEMANMVLLHQQQKMHPISVHSNLLTIIFTFVRLESPIKANDLFTKISRFLDANSSDKKFKSLGTFVLFVQASCGNAIKVQALGNEYFLVWNEKALGASLFVEVMEKAAELWQRKLAALQNN